MNQWLVRNILFPIHERVKGHPTYKILNEMEAADRLSMAEMERLRRVKLQEFIRYCYEHVSYVRARMQEANLQPGHIREPSDLALLPLMRKADVRRHRAALRSAIAGRLSPIATGGSTGDPLICDLSKRRIASRVACRQRVARWWGVSVGDREMALWGAPAELRKQDWIRSVRDRLLSTRLLSAFEMSPEKMSRYVEIIRRKRIKQIFAYPSAIYLLCLHARKHGIDLRQAGVKVVFVTSEVLYPYQREVITETLHCPVADGYGGRESGFIAHECPEGGMHILADAAIVELVDSKGRPVRDGEPGEIVVTDLYSQEAPFLRYATGDIGVLSSRRCPCGRPLPLFERIYGRSNDCIVAPDGRVINDQSLVYVLREIDGIEQFRIYQKRSDVFHVQIVRNEQFRPDGEERLRKSWSHLLRSRVEIWFEYLPALPAERSGKFRHVVSEVLREGNVRHPEEDSVPLI
jgi:phenylacetate-CoA ligase